MNYGDSSERSSGMIALTKTHAMADVWTFCAIDVETKIVPAFRCANRFDYGSLVRERR